MDMFKRTLALAAVCLAIAAAPAWSQVKELPWGTSAVGSAGHKALVVLADMLNREMKNYRITVQPTPGAIITVKGYATGQFEGYYGSDIAFYELAHDSNRFKGFKAQMKRQPVQSMWTFTVEVGTGIAARNKDKIKRWADLTGKPVFTGPLPWDVRAHLERAYAALGVKHQYRQVDLTAAGSLLQSGALDGFIIYTNGEAAAPPWIAETSLATDWVALNPSADELAALKKAGFAVTTVPGKVFKREAVGVDKVTLLPFYYGFHVGLEVPEEDVYRMLTIVEKNVAQLAKSDPAYSQIAKDMVGMQKAGIQSSIQFVPIHPGLAKYMREKGAWDSKWDSRIAKK
jgi:TRAP transporter TAXI family solute receptor